MADLAVLLVASGAEAPAPERELLRAVLAAGTGAGIEWIVAFVSEGPLVAVARGTGVATHLVRAREPDGLLARGRAARDLETLARTEQVSLVFGWGSAGQLLAGPAAWLADIPCGWYQSNEGEMTVRDRAATLLRARGVVVCTDASEAEQARLRPHRPLFRVTDASSFAAAVRDLTLGDEDSVTPIPDA